MGLGRISCTDYIMLIHILRSSVQLIEISKRDKQIFEEKTPSEINSVRAIGLYRDVWIAAIASSRTNLATLTGVMCNTSQCKLRSLRVHFRMLNVMCIVTYYTLQPLESPDSFWIAMAFSR